MLNLSGWKYFGISRQILAFQGKFKIFLLSICIVHLHVLIVYWSKWVDSQGERKVSE